MDQVKKVIIINMEEYGMEGLVEMRKPSPRKQNEFKNAVSKYYDFMQGEKTLKADAKIGDLELLMMLQYVARAPFPTTVEGILSYTDKMDPDYANEFMAKIEEGTKELIAYSPFVQSQSAGAENSE